MARCKSYRETTGARPITSPFPALRRINAARSARGRRPVMPGRKLYQREIPLDAAGK